MRRAICSNSARRCASCEQTAGCAFLLCHLQSNLLWTHGPGVEASWAALHTTAMGRPTDTKLCRHRRQGAADGRVHHRGNFEAMVKTGRRLR
ncbi:hypothetical protein SNOG_20162 [Parastagonospora nodorum SN15]|uniref:Uncharacterized protein n=1 Tax=Phaeosphaeria nodorum (strain SN15 / ATCC MYA-4574 / FGSC 10173) TaxID=321614 RepID=A9JXF8_PHANO|nr:hypothetical protein SNOG_20162 [Parastagonospora nodorum SN15]EDP89859.1 hypothetical protein SNOG_20162 [Parastagonospora nodorum SN15]